MSELNKFKRGALNLAGYKDEGKPPKRVLFLDIDGVINNNKSLTRGIHLLPEKMLLINDICERGGAKVVVSSTWRLYVNNKREMAFWLNQIGLRAIFLHDMTPVLHSRLRGEEIQAWMNEHNFSGRYVIIDDDNDFLPEQRDCLVRTNPNTGITSRQAEKAIKILTGGK